MTRITFFTKPDCSLCRSALYVIERVRRSFAFDFQIIDISAEGNEDWSELYHNDIPVAHLNGVEIFRHHVDERHLREVLRGHAS